MSSFYIQPNAAIAALLAGEIDAVDFRAGHRAAVLAGGNLTMIAGLLNKMIYLLHAQKEIKAPPSCAAKSSARTVSALRITESEPL
jgi:hypothetical protein